MVSVIVSAYKDRGWLDAAIQSAINQDFKDKEVILSSDGNEDLYKYATKYSIDFVLTPKGNHSSSFNNAISYARGEWIKECHDDDILLPDAVTNLYNARGEADLVYGNAIDVWFNGNETIYVPPAKITLSSFLPVVSNPINFLTIMFKKSVRPRFDTNLVHGEDYDFYLSLYLKGYKFAYCPKEVVRYRHHAGQLTEIFYQEKREFLRKYIIKKHNIYEVTLPDRDGRSRA
jgi:glycosyltransferase involved in cell wall biosynthesis